MSLFKISRRFDNSAKLSDRELQEYVEKIRFHCTALGALDSRDITQTATFNRVVTDTPVAIFNGVFAPRFTAAHFDSEVSAALAPIKERSVPALICIGPLSGSLGFANELDQVLRRHGCAKVATEFDLGLRVHSFRIPKFLFNKVELRAADTLAEKEAWTDLLLKNFELPAEARAHFLRMLTPDRSYDVRLHCFFGIKDAKTVGTVMLVQLHSVVGVYCVSVNSEFRRGGWGTSMMAATYRWGQDQNDVQYFVGNSNESAYKLYSKAPTIASLGQTQVYEFNPGRSAD